MGAGGALAAHRYSRDDVLMSGCCWPPLFMRSAPTAASDRMDMALLNTPRIFAAFGERVAAAAAAAAATFGGGAE